MRKKIGFRFCRVGFVFFLSVSAFADSAFYQSHRLVGPGLPPDSIGPRSSSPIQLYAGAGSWDLGVDHLKRFFRKYHYSYHSTNAEEILKGSLSKSSGVLLMPGGESWVYLDDLSSSGAEAIRNFVANGGFYVGICAGSFYAVSHREGGKKTGPYGIGLLDGVAFDGTALEVSPFIEGMLDFQLEFPIWTMGLGPSLRVALFGGPSFRYSLEEAAKKQVEVIARFPETGEVAMLKFRYGKGRVFLSAPHLEVEEPLTDWGEELEDPDSEWPLLNRVIRESLNAVQK